MGSVDYFTFRLMCGDCSRYHPKKGSCSDNDEKIDRTITVINGEAKCSSKKFSLNSQWHFLKAVHYSLKVSDTLTEDAKERLCSIAEADSSPEVFDAREYLERALNNLMIDSDDF